MGTPIPGLRGTPTHQLAVQLFQDHHDAGDGRCAKCGLRPPCPAQWHAASVIQAAGEDPRQYETGPDDRHQPEHPDALAEMFPHHVGYRVADQRPAPGQSDHLYQRDTG